VPPMGLTRLQSVVCRADPQVIGSLRRRLQAVSIPECWLLGGPSPVPCEPGSFSLAVSPLRSTTLDRSYARPSSPVLLPAPFSSGRPARVSSLFAAPPPVSTRTRAHPPALRSVLGFSQPLDGLLHRWLCGLIASRSHVQGLLRSGVSPATQHRPARHRALPPCRCPARAHRLPGCHARIPRLRGLAPRCDAFREFRGLA